MKIFAFEGSDGAGKSSLISKVQACLESEGLIVVTRRLPGGTPLGESLRKLMLEGYSRHNPMSEMLLAIANFCDIESALPEDTDVLLLDRWSLSTVAYQSVLLPWGEAEGAAFRSSLYYPVRSTCTLRVSMNRKGVLDGLFYVDCPKQQREYRRGLRNTTDAIEESDLSKTEQFFEDFVTILHDNLKNMMPGVQYLDMQGRVYLEPYARNAIATVPSSNCEDSYRLMGMLTSYLASTITLVDNRGTPEQSSLLANVIAQRILNVLYSR